MKKLFIAFLLLFASQGIFAQHDWKDLNAKYVEAYRLAEIISEQTTRVKVSEDNVTHIGIVRKGDVSVNFDRKLDSRETQGKFYKYYLGSSDSPNKAQLDKIATEKVLDKYVQLLTNLKVSLDEERDDKVDDLLNSLFN